MQERLYSYNKVVNSNFSVFKDSIAIPTRIKRITQVCAYLANGDNHTCRGFLSLYNEDTNEQIVNTIRINNDKRHYNYKAIRVNCEPEGSNFNFVMNMSNVDKTQECRLVILMKYQE